MKKKLLLHLSVGLVFLLCFLLLFQIGNKNNIDPNALSHNTKVNKTTINNDFKKNHKKVLKNKKNVMMGHADLFAQMQREIRTRGNENWPSYPLNYKNIEINKAKQMLSQKGIKKSQILKAMEINERGPANVGGRTRAIVVDPNDTTKNTWFAGAVGGGIWKTTDAGQSWENKTTNIPNLAISTMEMSLSNPNVIWAGTGEGFYNVDGIRGDGLLVSIDHGDTWKQVTGTTNFGCVNRLIVDPNDENTVLAAVSTNLNETYGQGDDRYGRIYKTTNGGNTWDMVYEDENKNRIQHIISNPYNFNVQYASVNSVGVLKTTDAGQTWTQVFNIDNGKRYELAIAPSDTSVIYAAIEGNGTSMLYKSIDSGQNWSDVSEGSGFTNWLGAQGWYDNAIGINPYDANDVYLGGVRLWKLFEKYGGISDVNLNNTDSYMAILPWGGYNNTGIGTGQQFSELTGLPSPFAIQDNDYVTVEMRLGSDMSQKAHRFSYDGQQTAYEDYIDVPFEIWDTDNDIQLMVSFLDINNNGEFDLVEYNDQMCEFVFVNAVAYNTSPNSNIMGYNNVGFMYKNTYVIASMLIEGGTWEPENIPESNIEIVYDNSGNSIPGLVQLSDGYNPGSQTGTHVDHHNLTIIKMDDTDSTIRIINGNDGGVFYSDDKGESWIHTLHGYNTSQFYGVDKKHGADEYIGGMQDNGTWQSPAGTSASASSNWNFRIGGDGYETSWHYTNPNLIIGGYQFNGLMRSTNGGNSWTSMASQIENGSGNAPFVTKVAKSNSDPDLIFAVGASGVWRSDNFGENWNLIPIPEEQWGMTSLTQAEISYANPQVVWAGARMSDPAVPDASLHVSTNGGVSFEPVNGFDDVVLGRVSGLSTHPVDENTAYAMFSFSGAPKILRTTNLGNTWEDISGFATEAKSSNGFPDVATYSLLVMPHNTDIIWAGTEIGLFESTDNGESWHYAIEEFPAVSIWQMNITDDQVVMATHGRGIITVTIPELPDPPVVTLAPKILSNGFDIFNEKYEIKAQLRSAYDSTKLFVNNEYYLTIASNSTPKDTIISFAVTEFETVDFQLVSYKNTKEYISGILTETVYPLLNITTGYVNNFKETTTDFVGNDFMVIDYDGFTHKALHSIHPYTDNIDITYMLRAPIIIDEENSEMSFNEIVIVEPGELGATWPSTSFYDFVIVEGSKNGKQWFKIENGYDAQDYDEWVDAFNGNIGIDESLFRKRTIDLDNIFFNAGDTILLRFRLSSDGGVTAWGWAIDSLAIQKQNTAIAERNLGKTNLYLAQNYPNPFSSFTNITYTLPNNGLVTLSIFDINGRLIETLVDKHRVAGEYTTRWESNSFKTGTYFYQIRAGEFTQTKKLLLIK